MGITWSVNITPVERAARVILGLLGVLGGALLIGSSGSTLAVILEVLLVVAGFDLLVTGLIGHCPLYKKLGHTPASLKANRS